MKRNIGIIMILALLISSFSFANPTQDYKSVGLELKELGIIKGQEGGELNELSQLNREDSIIILSRMMGKEKEAQSTTMDSGFTDVKDAYYKPFISYAKLQNWTNGMSPTEFGMKRPVTAKAMASYLLRALGYTADWATEDIMAKAASLGITKGVAATENTNVTRGEVFVMMKNTLYCKPNSQEKELIYKLGLKEEPKTEPKPVEPEKPKTEFVSVESVKVTGQREITVAFNMDVAYGSESFKMLNTDGSVVQGLGLTMKANGKNVVISLIGAELGGKTFNLKVKDVVDKATSKIKMEKDYTHSITFGDTKFDGISSVTFYTFGKYADSHALFIEYKEAVDSTKATDLSYYKYSRDDQNYMNFDNASIDMVDDKTVVINIDKVVFRTKYYNIRNISVNKEVCDLAGNKIAGFEMRHNVVVASQQPVISKVYATNANTVVAEFNQPVQTSNKENINFELVGQNAGIVPFMVSSPLTKYRIDSGVVEANKITFTLRDALPSSLLDTANNAIKLSYIQPSIEKQQIGTDLGGVLSNVTGVDIEDKIAPIVAIKQLKNSVNIDNAVLNYDYSVGSEDKMTIEIAFGEDINPASVRAEDFIVTDVSGKNCTVESATANGKVVKLVIKNISFDDLSNYSKLFSNEGAIGEDNANSNITYYRSNFRYAINVGYEITDTKGNAYRDTSFKDVYFTRNAADAKSSLNDLVSNVIYNSIDPKFVTVYKSNAVDLHFSIVDAYNYNVTNITDMKINSQIINASGVKTFPESRYFIIDRSEIEKLASGQFYKLEFNYFAGTLKKGVAFIKVMN